MKLTNTKIKKNSSVSLNTYEMLIISIISVSILLAIIVWCWYGHKDAQIENELLRIK